MFKKKTNLNITFNLKKKLANRIVWIILLLPFK